MSSFAARWHWRAAASPKCRPAKARRWPPCPAVAWFARQGEGRPRHDRQRLPGPPRRSWMGEIYRFLGLSVGYVQQGMTAAERRAAYACDITYATANEIGFDFLRDRLALRLEDQVHRPFAAAVIDEADSILIDEARIPLVIAGGDTKTTTLWLTRPISGPQLPRSGALHSGCRAPQCRADGCWNRGRGRTLSAAAISTRSAIFRLLTAVQDSLHAHVLLRRDVDYVVKNGAIEMVDEFKGRIAQDRRWPAGLHTAVEVKEGVAAKRQGMDPRLDHAAAPGRALSAGLRHDRHRRHPGARVRKGLRHAGGGDSDQSARDPRGSSGRGLRDESGEGTARFWRRSAACTRTANRFWWEPAASKNRNG